MKNMTSLLIVLILCPVLMYGAVLEVPSQYPTIQSGIDAANPGDTVSVAPGTYFGAGNINIEFRGKSLHLLTSDGPIETVIDCRAADSSGRGFYVHEGEGPATVIEGFTVINGVPNSPGGSGGGIMCNSSAPTIYNCIFRNCGGYNGGAAGCYNGANPRFIRCEFYENGARYGGAVGVHSSFDSITFDSCVFAGNSGEYGAAVYGYNLTFNNCTFHDNKLFESYPGHGAIEFSAAFVYLNNCLVTYTDYGMAVFNGDSSHAVLTCCDIYGNEGGDYVNVIAGYNGINGNFSEEPQYCAPRIYNLGVGPESPCLPNNNGCGVLIGALGQGCEIPFICGDVNGDGRLNLLDILKAIRCIYYNPEECDPSDLDPIDYNDDGEVTLLEIMYLINHLYKSGPPPDCDL